MSSVSMDEIAACLDPIFVCCFGWFCLDYHLADLPNRVGSICALILASCLASAGVATEENVSRALQSMLRKAPSVMVISPTSFAAIQPLPSPGIQQVAALTPFAMPSVPCASSLTCKCGRRLVRWKLLPAMFLTLAAGLLNGRDLMLRCCRCKTAHAGCWCWKSVEESGIFPGCFHLPKCVLHEWPSCLWISATPQMVW